MYTTTYLDDLIVWAPAKVNLFLETLAKRPDGYHEIATLIVAIRRFDTLVFRPAPNDVSLSCSNRTLSCGPDNLVLKAARLLRERTGCTKGASIRLTKRIPMAAGLAGGSSDAAATLIGLNQLWQLGRSDAELAKLAGEIGSDVPFFFHLPAAWCTGRGEIVEPARLPNPLHFVLLCPSFGLSTADVYKQVVLPEKPASGDAIRAALEQGDVDSIGRLAHNRLQMAAEKIDRRIAEFAALLKDAGSAGSLMSGSGSTLFALCKSAEDAERVAAHLRARIKPHDARIIVTRTV